MNVLLIDNSGVGTFSLAEAFEKRGCSVTVFRNDASVKSIESAIKKHRPRLIVLSSGSEGLESETVKDIIRNYHASIPLFGVGVGLHLIIEAFEGRVDRAIAVMHAKTSKVEHDGKTIFSDINSPFTAGRYNSLVASEVPYNFEVSARDEQGAVMAIRHKEVFVEAVQFNPESILTPVGARIIDNVLSYSKK